MMMMLAIIIMAQREKEREGGGRRGRGDEAKAKTMFQHSIIHQPSFCAMATGRIHHHGDPDV